MRKLIVFLLAAVLAWTSGPAHAAGTGQAEPVLIGAVYNLSGSQASLDVPGFEGMKLAVERINKEGGVLGRQVKLVMRDGASDPELCRAAAKELAGLGIVAMAGLNDSDFALIAGEVSTRAGIPFVTAGATLPSLPRMLGPYFFMACYSDSAQAKAVAKFALRKADVESMLLLANRDTAFTTSLAGYFTRAYRQRGGAIPSRVSFSQGSPEPLKGADLSCIAAGTCKGVFVAGVPDDAIPTVSALRAAGFSGPVFSGDGFDTKLLDQLGDKAGPGIFFSTHVSYDSPGAQVRRFVSEWKAAHGSEPESGFAALGYDAVGLIADAVRRAGSIERGQVRRALAATRSYPGVTGSIGYPEPLQPPLKPVFIVREVNGVRTYQAEVLP